jgi:hypothetical protein
MVTSVIDVKISRSLKICCIKVDAENVCKKEIRKKERSEMIFFLGETRKARIAFPVECNVCLFYLIAHWT